MERDGDGQECERAWFGVMQCEGQCSGDANGSPRQQRAGRSRLVKNLASLSETSGGSLGGEFWTIEGNAGYRHSALVEERKEEEEEEVGVCIMGHSSQIVRQALVNNGVLLRRQNCALKDAVTCRSSYHFIFSCIISIYGELLNLCKLSKCYADISCTHS